MALQTTKTGSPLVLRLLRGPFFPNAAHKSLRFIVAGGKGKACRPPGALTDTLRAKMCKPGHDGANRGARIASAALRRSEIIAENRLDVADRLAELPQIPLDESRKALHEQPMADVGGRRR